MKVYEIWAKPKSHPGELTLFASGNQAVIDALNEEAKEEGGGPPYRILRFNADSWEKAKSIQESLRLATESGGIRFLGPL